MTVLLADIGNAVKKQLNPMFAEALYQQGIGNELGINVESFLGMLAARNRITTQLGGEYAEELIVESAVNNTGKFVDSDEVLGLSKANEDDELRIPWKEYRDIVKVKRIDKAKASGGQLHMDVPGIMTKLTGQKLKNAMENFEVAALNSTGVSAFSKTIFGIPYWIADTGVLGAGSYQVDRAVDTWAKSIIVDATSSSKLTIALLRQLRDAMVIQRGKKPSIFLTNQVQLTNYHEDLEGANRARVHYTTLQIGDSEFNALYFDGIPVIAVPGYIDTRCDGIDLSNWMLKVLVDAEGYEDMPQDPEAIDYEGFTFNLHPLPVSSSHYAMELEIFLQLVCERPWEEGGIINLNT